MPVTKKSPRPGQAPAASRKPGCPIVGIGASSGGLEAFTQLLRQMPVDTGLGFVLVQHLDPQHDSALAQLLTRATAMPVREVTNNLRVEANHVYIIPPNTSLGLVRGVLKLRPRSAGRVAPRSIDFFFEALARDQRDRAVGVILSGNATDGTLGLEAIKAEGGLTFAQDDSARSDSMPRSAVDAGCVDFVLSPGGIAKELARIARHPYVARRAPRPGRGAPRAAAAGAGSAGSREPQAYDQILRLLRNHCGVDFSLYKSSTIHRRITRRIVLNRQSTLENYARFLLGNPAELDALYSDALIGVTSFFRNAEAFALLQRKVFPKLLAAPGHEPLRVWVLGCSTGQEAYSIAMAFAESAEKTSRARKLQIFATDLKEANLEKARQGYYAKGLVQDVSPGRLRRFFVEEDGGYRIIKPLRESVVFACQNVISDPPFSRMDLISCRNLMIYLEPSLQKKVIPTFHYALKPGGFLFLGASESIGGSAELFAPVDKKQKIFVRKAAPTLAFPLPIRPDGTGRAAASRTPTAANGRKPENGAGIRRNERSAEQEADRVTINHFAPAGVLVSADLQILQFRGSTGPYLEAPTGKATFHLLKMAREGLMLPLRAALQRAQQENSTARVENVAVKEGNGTRLVHVEVVPLKNLPERCFLVLFEDAVRPRNPEAADRAGTAKEQSRVHQRAETRRVAGLERDLSETRDYLQSVQEHHDSANEELQASNEEGQSANEELQSLNEELETSKEELESTNEELTTVNEEMVTRNTELNRLNGELGAAQGHAEAIIRTVAVPLVILTTDLRVHSVNEAFSRAFKTTPAQMKGRAIFEVDDGAWNFPGLRRLLEDVLGRGGVFDDFEVEHRFSRIGHRHLLLNARLLVEPGGKSREILLGLQDVTERRRADAALQEARSQLAQHAGRLETEVAVRTLELTASNQHLKSSVASIRQGKDEYRLLLGQSEVMQKRLRLLTHQIITAQEEERKEISRELHDEVVQTLIGVNVELTALRKGDVTNVAGQDEKVVHIQRLVENSVTAVHRFARGLRPAVLDDLGLIPALHAYCKSLADKQEIKIQLTAFGGVEQLGDAERTVLFRVAQEALTNVARHAKATEVKLRITAIPNAIRMEISDNGRSFRVRKVLGGRNHKRLGLVGMNERIEMVGGTLGIESAPGIGTTVRAEIPFQTAKTKK
jgi:two-component system CheB/CheR fusion protein